MAIGSYPSPPSENAPAASTSSDVRDGYVRVCLRDGHDDKGPGMTCDMLRSRTFENIFGHFKARSCKKCRAPSEMRFKKQATSCNDADLASPSDTPFKVGFRSGGTYQIHVWSNVPGLQCAECKLSGYPKTVGVDEVLSTKTPPPCTTEGASETITLVVKDQTGFMTTIKMLNTTSFDYLMEIYADRAMRDREYCRFLADGERLPRRQDPGLRNNPPLTISNQYTHDQTSREVRIDHDTYGDETSDSELAIRKNNIIHTSSTRGLRCYRADSEQAGQLTTTKRCQEGRPPATPDLLHP